MKAYQRVEQGIVERLSRKPMTFSMLRQGYWYTDVESGDLTLLTISLFRMIDRQEVFVHQFSSGTRYVHRDYEWDEIHLGQA